MIGKTQRLLPQALQKEKFRRRTAAYSVISAVSADYEVFDHQTVDRKDRRQQQLAQTDESAHPLDRAEIPDHSNVHDVGIRLAMKPAEDLSPHCGSSAIECRIPGDNVAIPALYYLNRPVSSRLPGECFVFQCRAKELLPLNSGHPLACNRAGCR